MLFKKYTHNWSLQPFSQDYSSSFFFWYISVGAYSLKSTPNDRLFWETFHGNFIHFEGFSQKSAERKSPKKYFLYFILLSGLGLFLLFIFTLGRPKASGIVLFFRATNSQGIILLIQCFLLGLENILWKGWKGEYGSNEVRDSNSPRKEQLLSKLQCAIHWQINHKSMCYVF